MGGWAIEDDVAIAAAKWQLDRISPADVRGLAIRLLDQGHASPALDELAKAPSVAAGGALRELTARAFAEIGFVPPTRDEAALLLSVRIATEIAYDRIVPYEGAQQIWDLAYDVGPEAFPLVAPFAVLASRLRDGPHLLGAESDLQIKDAAQRLLDELD